MGFIMDGLDAEAYDRNYSDRQLVGRIIGYFRPKLRVMLLIAALITLTSLLDTVFPVLISFGIDTVVASGAVQIILLLIIAILLSGVFSWVCNFFRQWNTARTVGDVVLKLRRDAFQAVVARDMSFYDEFPSGKIVSRVTSDSEDFATVVTLALNLISQLLLFFLMAIVLLIRSVQLALLTFTILPLIVLVALARVLLQDPSIIILDEATASVDPLTEAQIQEGLDLVLQDRTAILIAHRLSTIRHADRIIVLDRGRIVEEGNHDALMQQGGHYAVLYNTYWRHQSPDYRPGEGFVFH